MFSGAFSIGHLIVVLVIVLLLFGTKKLKNLGSDLGGAIKGFKNALNEGEKKEADTSEIDATKKVTEEKSTQQADLNKVSEPAKSEQK
ncbi:MAG TPA: Sec-independent protein translocase subunit TatA [Cellvibrionaceae bacterium]|nr:Sec-independent protein translocase subunit TatA [Cellvibrionaceae bacterium]HMW71472.1 Sec-independent protein translocase subunit TatA [Cellvibrionaceae bacterium]HNG60218.1 Sec-independent protein translocase subunit TatA [Cellvibrionaceae bacterium]